MKTRFVLGFAFRPDWSVVLTRMPKDCPHPHLRGRWNGVGGFVRNEERTVDAMTREFAEEAGLYVSRDRWFKSAMVHGHHPGEEDGYTISVYRAHLHSVEWPSDQVGTQKCEVFPTGPGGLIHGEYPGDVGDLALHVAGLAYLCRFRSTGTFVHLHWDDGLLHRHRNDEEDDV